MDHLPAELKFAILKQLEKERGESLTQPSISTLPERLLAIEGSYGSNLQFWTQDRVDALNQNGYFVVDDWLGDSALSQCRTDAESLFSSGLLRPGHMRDSSSLSSAWKSSARGDHILFLRSGDEEIASCSGISQILHAMSSIQREVDLLNDARTSKPFSSTNTEFQLAVYDAAGTGYVMHRDAGPNGPYRRLTVIYYINDKSDELDGGALRILLPHPDQVPSSSGDLTTLNVDLAPRGDRLIVFQSEWLWHQVCPTNFRRMAITMWIR